MDFSLKSAFIPILFLTFILNLYFGYLRGRTRRFSFAWFLCIHMPIPLVILARVLSDLDYQYIPVSVFAAVTGQVLGGKLEF